MVKSKLFIFIIISSILFLFMLFYVLFKSYTDDSKIYEINELKHKFEILNTNLNSINVEIENLENKHKIEAEKVLSKVDIKPFLLKTIQTYNSIEDNKVLDVQFVDITDTIYSNVLSVTIGGNPKNSLSSELVNNDIKIALIEEFVEYFKTNIERASNNKIRIFNTRTDGNLILFDMAKKVTNSL